MRRLLFLGLCCSCGLSDAIDSSGGNDQTLSDQVQGALQGGACSADAGGLLDTLKACFTQSHDAGYGAGLACLEAACNVPANATHQEAAADIWACFSSACGVTHPHDGGFGGFGGFGDGGFGGFCHHHGDGGIVNFGWDGGFFGNHHHDGGM